MENGERHYRTEIPNIIDDSDLSPYAFRLYAHIKRVAGDNGKCYQGTRALAEACKMSVGEISKAKKELLEAKFIRITPASESYTRTDLITVVDLWNRNHKKYTKKEIEPQRSPDEQTVHGMNDAFTTRTERSPDEQECSRGELKKEPIKKELTKKEPEKKSSAPERDPLIDHEAVIAFKAENKFNLNADQRKEVAARVRDLSAWVKVLHEGRINGNRNPKQLAYLLNDYDREIEYRERKNDNGAQRANGSAGGHSATDLQEPSAGGFAVRKYSDGDFANVIGGDVSPLPGDRIPANGSGERGKDLSLPVPDPEPEGASGDSADLPKGEADEAIAPLRPPPYASRPYITSQAIS